MSKKRNCEKKVWYKNKFVWISVVSVLSAIVVIPLLIMLCYAIGNFYVPWTEVEYLLYMGSVIACLGAVFLGIVSLVQNKNASRISESLLQLERAKYLSMVDISLVTKASDLNECHDVEDFEMHKYKTDDDILICALVRIENRSPYPIVQASICLEKTGVTLLNNNTAFYDNVVFSIPANGTKIIRVASRIHMKVADKFTVGIRLGLVNVFDFSTKGTFYVKYENYSPISGNFRYAKITDVK